MNNNLKSRENELIANISPKSPITETFRSIRTNLDFMSPDNPLQTIMITSCVADEGKSFILSNLAVSLAQNRKEVIIIDADLRKPVQHYFFSKPNLKGLSNILTGEVEVTEVLRETGIERVRLLTAGHNPPNPAELLDSRRMETVLADVQSEADMVLIDVPPILMVTDALLMARKVDGVILVIASHETHKDMLVKAQESLERAKANILGTILNKFPFQESSNYYNTYYQSYYTYYGDSEEG